MARARVMAGGEGAPTTLAEALRSIAAGGNVSGDAGQKFEVARLWDGLPTLFARELPFGVAKLLVYARALELLLGVVPAARERPFAGLLVSLAAGLLAGVSGCLVSQPADVVVTRLATGGFGNDWQAALASVLSGGGDDASAIDKVRLLYAGTAQRCISLALLVTLQFALFDSLRALLAVSPKDLSLVLDVFQDRLSFYAGWDEMSGSWGEIYDNLDDDLRF
ncbi:hypothetical protein T492DRAFT_39212 [Pavlovales sp. CCMP2436]|nr:hypothetical protein T492DRAFT_39212 [Pavlovales sp. CCMP2436]